MARRGVALGWRGDGRCRAWRRGSWPTATWPRPRASSPTPSGASTATSRSPIGTATTLWLARDRLGVRPLYYARCDDGFAFASRPRPLLRLPGVSRALDPRYLGVFAGSHYRYFDNQPERSPYLGVEQVPAGHVVRIRGDDVRVTRYWGLDEAPDSRTISPSATANCCWTRCGGGWRPDAAFTLSGGLDSSSVLACAVHAHRRSRTRVLDGLSRLGVRRVARRSSRCSDLVAEWHRVTVAAPDVLDLVARMIEAHDEPVATATWLSHYLLCERVAADGFRTLFGGLGGDELNAGEYEHFFFRFADLEGAERDHEIAEWARHHDHPVFHKDAATAAAVLARVADFTRPGRVRVDRERLERYRAAVAFDLDGLRAGARPSLRAPTSRTAPTRTCSGRRSRPACAPRTARPPRSGCARATRSSTTGSPSSCSASRAS